MLVVHITGIALHTQSKPSVGLIYFLIFFVCARVTIYSRQDSVKGAHSDIASTSHSFVGKSPLSLNKKHV